MTSNRRSPNTSDTCRTCGNAVSAPFRSWDTSGRIVHGCVDGDHTGHIVGYESLRWHNRPEAKAARKALETLPTPR